MMEYSSYYETELYPIQNEVLKNLKSLNLPFYLTGGTAASRGYFHHRYSDDLDLFANNAENFLDEVDKAISSLAAAGFKVEVSTTASENFSQIYINKDSSKLNKNGLKVDFVNDIDLHFGELSSTDVYYKTDSIRNILSNKYTALYRLSVKDVADICEISRHFPFSWKKIIDEANKKEAGIDLKEVVEIFKSYSDKALESVKWAKPFNQEQFRHDIEKIGYDMLTLSENSLYRENLIKKDLSKEELGKLYISEVLKNCGNYTPKESSSIVMKSIANNDEKKSAEIKEYLISIGINNNNDFNNLIEKQLNEKKLMKTKTKSFNDFSPTR